VKKHRAYEGPSDEFLDRLAEPIEAAVLDYIDANHDYLAQKFIQPRLKRAQAPSEEMLANLRKEADTFMDDVLPQLMLDKVDIQRLGLDRFIAERMNENELARITNQALGIPGMASVTPKQVTYALRRIAARIDASKKPDSKLVSRDLECVLAAMTEQNAIFYTVDHPDSDQPWYVAVKPDEVEEWQAVSVGLKDQGATITQEEGQPVPFSKAYSPSDVRIDFGLEDY
jgi:hypothetical protein